MSNITIKQVVKNLLKSEEKDIQDIHNKLQIWIMEKNDEMIKECLNDFRELTSSTHELKKYLRGVK